MNLKIPLGCDCIQLTSLSYQVPIRCAMTVLSSDIAAWPSSCNMDITQAVPGWWIVRIRFNGVSNLITCIIISALDGMDIFRIAVA